MRVTIKAIEYYLPTSTEDGDTLKKDNPDWRIEDIEKKTGVQVRHICGFEKTATEMARLAIEKLFASGLDRESVDFLILVTQSPEYILPTSACILQDRLGLKKSCMAFDINLGCSGFIYGLAVGGSMIESGLARKGIVCCSDTYTRYIDKSDRTSRPLFSDGSAAALISLSGKNLLGPFEMGTDGSGFRNMMVPSNPKQTIGTESYEGRLFMDGSKLFLFTMEMIPKCVTALLEKTGKTTSDIDLFVFHQASKLVLDNIIRRLDLPHEKVFTNYPKVGNTVSASIPIALKDALSEKRLKNGDQVMLVGFGVGYSWGGCLIEWEAVS
jgi:3-oxoacyl-[acyl-carrier-protein] synthase-3